jgi:hypothetical protein
MTQPKGLSSIEARAWNDALSAIADIKSYFGKAGPMARKVQLRAWRQMIKASEVLGFTLPSSTFDNAYPSAIFLSREMGFISGN